MKIFLPGEFLKLDPKPILADPAWDLIARAKAEGIPLTVNEARKLFAGNLPEHPDASRGAMDVSAADDPKAGDELEPAYDTASVDSAVVKEGK